MIKLVIEKNDPFAKIYNALPLRSQLMLTYFHITEGKICRDCVYYQFHRTENFHTCLQSIRPVSSSTESNRWKEGWPACGLFQNNNDLE